MKKPLPTSKPRYKVVVAPPARKQLLQLPVAFRASILSAIDDLEHNPRPSGVVKLKGGEGYRIRVGEYRVRYLVFDKVLLIEVVQAGPRGNFYDKR